MYTERSKWVNYFDQIQGLVYVVSLASYDQLCQFENAMLQSLRCWEQVCNNQEFEKGTSVMLLFNKWDLFERKIVNVPITVAFPHYQGPIADAQNGYEFIRLQFMSKVNTNINSCHCLRPISAIVTHNATQVFDDIHRTIFFSRIQLY